MRTSQEQNQCSNKNHLFVLCNTILNEDGTKTKPVNRNFLVKQIWLRCPLLYSVFRFGRPVVAFTSEACSVLARCWYVILLLSAAGVFHWSHLHISTVLSNSFDNDAYYIHILQNQTICRVSSDSVAISQRSFEH